MSHSDQPIAALASGAGAAALAVVRLSGRGALAALKPYLHHDPTALKARQLTLTKIKSRAGIVLDEPLVAVFYGPQSYTGEDSAELYLHGGPYVARRVLEELWAGGFRPAEPGEFTRRAFLHGKLDLTAAEGIKALAEANSEQEWLAARQLATGRLKDGIEVLRAKLVEAMAYLEAQIDFPDEGDTAHLGRNDARVRALATQQEVERLIETYASGKVASQGLMVTLAGEPNAGKSTLMNELLGRERAIVTDIAGTTRDYLEERCLVNGRLVRLIDTAGIRDGGDKVERLGIERAKQLISESDVTLLLVPADATQAAVDAADRWLLTLKPKSVLKLVTKADLKRPTWASGDWLPVSCKSGDGLNALRQRLAAAVDASVGQLGEAAFITTARHANSLRSAAEALTRYFGADAAKQYEEVLAFELQAAAKALQGIIGDVNSEDVLDKVFGDFCIGK